MDKEEIIKEMEMDYDQLVQYLLNKYGGSKYDYYVNESCKTKNKKVTRSNEGLLCHHIDEDKAYSLCSPVAAQCFSFEYQKKGRLVYCNYIEHLLLHILIGKNSYWKRRSTLESTTAFNLFITPGMGYICSDINGLFEKNGSSLKWKQRCYQEIKDNFDDYIFILNSFIEYLFNNYTGKKPLKVGQKVKNDTLGYGVITKIDGKNPDSKIVVEFDNCVKVVQRINAEPRTAFYFTEIDRMKRTLSSISRTELNQTVYERLLDI